jgi:hypothetical protein
MAPDYLAWTGWFGPVGLDQLVWTRKINDFFTCLRRAQARQGFETHHPCVAAQAWAATEADQGKKQVWRRWERARLDEGTSGRLILPVLVIFCSPLQIPVLIPAGKVLITGTFSNFL